MAKIVTKVTCPECGKIQSSTFIYLGGLYIATDTVSIEAVREPQECEPRIVQCRNSKCGIEFVARMRFVTEVVYSSIVDVVPHGDAPCPDQ